jgi:hypothetical protein
MNRKLVEGDITQNVPKGLAIFAPFHSFYLDIRGIFSQPLAFFGGLTGSAALCGAMVAMVMLGGATTSEESDGEELDLEFVPGSIARLGKKFDEKDLPDKIIVDETRAVDHQVDPADTRKVTENETPPDTKKDPPTDPKKTDKPSKSTGKKTGKESDKDTQGNNKWGDLPTVDELPGDPFGDVNGWADMTTAGDPWATAVMGALNKMSVGRFGAKAAGAAPFKFKIEICKDGTIQRALQRQSSGLPDLDAAILAEIGRLNIPKPPPAVAAAMKKPCMLLKYDFVWQAGTVK